MNRNDARKLIKSRHLSNSAEKVLLRVLDLTYRRDKDNPELKVEATSSSFQRAARVKARQLFNILKQLETDSLLLDVETGSHIQCRLNLEAIEKLPVYDPDYKAEAKKLKADRARKARERRAEVKEMERILTAVKDATHKDMAEFIMKTALLKDITDPDIKRSMMTWDIERIRRAKQNAEALQRGEV